MASACRPCCRKATWWLCHSWLSPLLMVLVLVLVLLLPLVLVLVLLLLLVLGLGVLRVLGVLG